MGRNNWCSFQHTECTDDRTVYEDMRLYWHLVNFAPVVYYYNILGDEETASRIPQIKAHRDALKKYLSEENMQPEELNDYELFELASLLEKQS